MLDDDKPRKIIVSFLNVCSGLPDRTIFFADVVVVRQGNEIQCRESKNMSPLIDPFYQAVVASRKRGNDISPYPSGNDNYPCVSLVLYKKCQRVENGLWVISSQFPPFKRNIFSRPSRNHLNELFNRFFASLVSIYLHYDDKWLVPVTFDYCETHFRYEALVLFSASLLPKGRMKTQISEKIIKHSRPDIQHPDRSQRTKQQQQQLCPGLAESSCIIGTGCLTELGLRLLNSHE